MFARLRGIWSYKPVQQSAEPFRMTYPDSYTYREPVPYGFAEENYQTYFMGNQLPGTLVSNVGPNYYYLIGAADLQAPQRAGGTPGIQQFSVQNMRQLMAAWGQKWAS